MKRYKSHTHRLKFPDSSNDEDSATEETNPTPFHFELKTPQPTAFVKRPRYPQLSLYKYPYVSRSIQDVIKYLASDGMLPKHGIKFTGVYVNPKKYDMFDSGDMVSDNDKSETEENGPYSIALNSDPFYQYKPKHPADVNLLATNNVRYHIILNIMLIL